MQLIQDIKNRLGVMGEVVGFLWQRKLWWLIPLILMLFILVPLILLSQNSVIAPFIYTLF
ncbi:MAG: hypothetical protein E6K65_01230 [Nitrospirae bacterium]|nr:MAG: hypothetical protein E6K65_01230 [Nitrospirota bacterium]